MLLTALKFLYTYTCISLAWPGVVSSCIAFLLLLLSAAYSVSSSTYMYIF